MKIIYNNGKDIKVAEVAQSGLKPMEPMREIEKPLEVARVDSSNLKPLKEI